MLGQLQLHATHVEALSCGIWTLRELDNAVLATQRFLTEGPSNYILYNMKITVLLLRILCVTLPGFPVPVQIVARSNLQACVDAAATFLQHSHSGLLIPGQTPDPTDLAPSNTNPGGDQICVCPSVSKPGCWSNKQRRTSATLLLQSKNDGASSVPRYTVASLCE